MAIRVLDVGQCQPDHSAIRGLLSRCGAEVVQAHGPADTMTALREGGIALVLINRKLDADYSDGLDIIKAIKADPSLSSVPVMLISNYPEAQQQAVAVGAIEGFGKAQLADAATEAKVRAALTESPSAKR